MRLETLVILHYCNAQESGLLVDFILDYYHDANNNEDEEITLAYLEYAQCN